MRRVAAALVFVVPVVLQAQRAEPAAARRPVAADTSPIGVRWIPPAPRAPSRVAATALRVIEGTLVAAVDARDQRFRPRHRTDDVPSVGSAALLGGLTGLVRPTLDVRPCLDRDGLAAVRLASDELRAAGVVSARTRALTCTP